MQDDHALRVHERLSSCPVLRPVGPAEQRRFGLWDLASLAEGALGECVDPDSLTSTRERELRVRLGAHGRMYEFDDEYLRPYWIRAEYGGGGRTTGPLGTVAVGTWPVGAGALPVWSLYVHPVARRRGLASTVLDTLYEACLAEGLHGFRLDAYWTWQKSVRYYLERGLWVTSWKHALGFARLSYLPRYEVRETEDELAFLTARHGSYASGPGEFAPLLVAGHEGGRLRLRETEEYVRTQDERDTVRLRHYARATLALHLAVRGRPLARGEEEWARASQWCDIGEPEGLAYKIGIFERVAREEGWRVDGPYRPYGTYSPDGGVLRFGPWAGPWTGGGAKPGCGRRPRHG
ncbi:GNAT family N-acetyltransferase [Streptomyces sp. NPDC002845]